MLLFIGKATGESVRKELFQYISCYSLSASTFKNRSEYWRFNTSHVTLYPAHPSTFTVIFAFQYISCYSLSESCCRCFCSYHVSIHLMLLFINITQERWIHMAGFNTSHVTLYHLIKGIRLTTPRVSIHLMLLFIVRSNRHGCARWLFQYISCYSLSWDRTKYNNSGNEVSIHLMLLFIIT